MSKTTGYPVLDMILACVEAGTHKVNTDEFGACASCGEYGDGPTNSWTCEKCSTEVYRFRGERDVSCDCGAEYNSWGQRLRDDWRGNPSLYDDDMDDMEGFERQQLAQEYYNY
jgi:hypothetical protein